MTDNRFSRREFMKWMGAGAAGVGLPVALSGCATTRRPNPSAASS